MFKNKKFEVKMVEDRPKADNIYVMPKQPRLTDKEIELVRDGAKAVGGVVVLLKVLDCTTKILVKKL